jgi:hypothetical protein
VGEERRELGSIERADEEEMRRKMKNKIFSNIFQRKI